MYFNTISVNGNLAADPRLGEVDGTPVLNFRIGQSNPFRKDAEGKPLTSWYNVALFGKQATTLSTRLKKGSHVLLKGEITIKDTTYNGEKRTFAEIRADTVQFVPSGTGAPQPSDDVTLEDVPF